MAGLKEIPAFVRDANDQEMLEIALIENTHREDLNALEVAINYKRLIDECNLTQEAMAESCRSSHEETSEGRIQIRNLAEYIKCVKSVRNPEDKQKLF